MSSFLKMRSIFGVSLEGVPLHHLPQFDIYKGKEETSSRKKEVQSSKKFYSMYKNTQDEALQWKADHAPDTNISCIIATIKTLEELSHDIKLHRICKTAYPLYVWMSYNKTIFERLDSFKCFAVNNQVGETFYGNPFTEARNQIEQFGYNDQNLYNAAMTLARRLLGCGHRITQITTVKFKNTVAFTAVSRKDPNGLNEYNFDKGLTQVSEYTPIPTPRPRVMLPDIMTLDNFFNAKLVFA